MLTREELDKIEQLKAAHPDFQYLFEKIEQEHQHILSQISHNIRNDLTLLMSSFQFTESSHPEVRSFKYWNGCRNDVICMRDFLEQLSDYYKSSDITYYPFNLETMLNDLVQSARYEHYYLPASIILQVEDSCPEIYGDTIKLYHALELILENSFEAISKTDGKITLTLSLSEPYCKISVSDNGSGFSEEIQQKLWTPFTSDKKHHVGLGLCIANRIILAHGGYIRLAHTGSNGSSLDIYLPLLHSGKYKQLIQQTN